MSGTPMNPAGALSFYCEEAAYKIEGLTQELAHVETQLAGFLEQRTELIMKITQAVNDLIALRAASSAFHLQIDTLCATPPEHEIMLWIVKGQAAYQEELLKEIVEE